MVDVAVPPTKPTTPTASPPDPSKTAGSRVVTGSPFQIHTTQSRTRWLKALFYGKHGAGKTELAASAVDVPSMGDVLLVDAESGDLTLEESVRIKNPDDISHIRVNTFKQVAYVQEFLKAHCQFRDSDNKNMLQQLESKVTGVPAAEIENPKKYRTVIIDSLTEVEAYCTYQILSIDNSKIPIDNDVEVAGWPEFRKNNEMVKLLVRAFRDLPMHTIFVCAEQYSQDEQKKMHYTPALTGKLSGQVQGFVDIVGWLTIGAPQSEGGPSSPRRLFVQPMAGPGIPKFDAKMRRATFTESYFDNPLMADIMKAVKLAK